MKIGNLAATAFLALGGALIVTACASTSPTQPAASPAGAPPLASSGNGAPSCQAMQAEASAEVGKVIEAGRACSQDDDCTTTGFGASCFDSCTRAVAKDHVAEVDAASKKASAGACRDFAAQGCKMTVPPCAPPQTPHCKAGVCT